MGKTPKLPNRPVFAPLQGRPSPLKLGARLRDRTATQRSKKGSVKVLGRVLGKASQKGSEKGVCHGLYSKKGF